MISINARGAGRDEHSRHTPHTGIRDVLQRHGELRHQRRTGAGRHPLRLRVRNAPPGYAPVAAFPLLFGVQQAMEGLLWLSLGGEAAIDARSMALGYLFFAYLLWPALVPAAAWRAEPEGWRRRAFLAIALLGLAFGASLYVPLLLETSWLSFRLERGSILYEPRLIHDAWMSRLAVRAIYALLVATPLVLSSDRSLRTFGAVVLASVIVSALAFEYAFVSIWCFFAAVLSLYIAWMLRRRPADPDHRPTNPEKFHGHARLH